jgi:hypothetical protein
MEVKLSPGQEADRMNNFVMTLLAKETLTYIKFVQKGEQWFTKEHKHNMSIMAAGLERFVNKVNADIKMKMQLNGVDYKEIMHNMDMNVEVSYMVAEVVKAIMCEPDIREQIYKVLNVKEVDGDGKVIKRHPKFELSKADLIDMILMFNPASTLHIAQLNHVREYMQVLDKYLWNVSVLNLLSEQDLYTIFRTIKDNN